MSEKLKRVSKNIIIVLLLLSAGVLTWMNWFSDPQTAGGSGSGFTRLAGALFGWDSGTQEASAYAAYEEYAYTLSAVCPATAELNTRDAFYHFVQREDMEALFDRASVVLATALDTARSGKILNTADWRSRLYGPSLLLRFLGEMPLYYFAASLGASQNADMDYAVSDLLLDFSADPVQLVVKTVDGDIYAYDTDLRGIDMQSFSIGMEPVNAQFACQNAYAVNRVPDETVVSAVPLSAPQLEVSPALTDFAAAGSERIINTILSSFGFNTYSVNSYIESDSTRVYVEETNTLRITPDGTLVFDNGAQDELKPMSGMDMQVRTQNIAQGALIVEQAVLPYLGDASAFLLRQYHDELSGNYVVVFSAVSDAIKIELPGGYLARFEFRGTQLVKAYVNLTTFSRSGTSDILLPSIYAAAAAGYGTPATVLETRYSIRGGIAKAAWYYGV